MPQEKKRILAELQRLRTAEPRRFWATAGVVGFSLFGVVAAFGTAPTTRDIQAAQTPFVVSLETPAARSVDTSGEIYVREERIQRGDTVAALLARLGVRDAQADDFLRNSPETQVLFRQIAPGKNVSVRVTAQGDLHSLAFPLNGGKDAMLQVERRGDGFSAKSESVALDTQVVMKTAEIRYSLFGATDTAGIPDSIATGLADIFGGDIDFHRDLRKGDRFSVIYETLSHQGKLVRTGRILAAEFVNNGKSHQALWHQPKDGQGGYYGADGKNLRKAFLRSPLEFSRITSGFTSSRFHPVLQQWRAHKGIDYGAPVGTRVKATGDGIVEFVGNQGGYGKVVTLRHQGRYTTVYGHLSGFAPGLRKGARVAQGDIVGYVGATGLASGPHLHYEFRVNDVHQNPLAMTLPTAPPLAPHQVSGFLADTAEPLARLAMIRGSNLALLD